MPISFLEAGLEISKSVVRVELENGMLGSGFLVNGNLLVTNNHVINSQDHARLATAQFNVQKNVDGLDLPSASFELDPGNGFATSVLDDWTIVRIKGEANAKWGAISINDSTVKKQDRVIIIQHPGGGAKSIALYHNIVAYADDTRVQYLTDTLPGSSGSPVFDSNWNLVAIHHSGGWIREPGSKRRLLRNEGIPVAKFSDAASGLQKQN